jgi:hypothetical protein
MDGNEARAKDDAQTQKDSDCHGIELMRPPILFFAMDVVFHNVDLLWEVFNTS